MPLKIRDRKKGKGLPYMKGNRIPVIAYLDPEQKAALDALAENTGLSTAKYLREAVEALLLKYKDHLPRSLRPIYKPVFRLPPDWQRKLKRRRSKS